MNGTLRSALKELVSAEALLPEAEVRGWSVGSQVPKAVVSPAGGEELSKLLVRCTEEGWKVMPAGMGTWLPSGGPAAVDLVLTTARMHDVHEYEPADLTITAGAGIPFADLGKVTGANGQWLPLDPPGARGGTLGALMAMGRGGPLRHQYGGPRDMVLGLTMVSGKGERLRWGGRVVKNVAGFDLTRLLTGSWGSLGVITSVSARLFPVPEMDLTLIWTAPSPGDLLEAGVRLTRTPLPMAGVQLLDPCPAFGSLNVDGAGLVVRLLGSRAEVKEMEQRVVGEYGRSTPTRLEGGESVSFHEKVNGCESGVSLALRMTLLPSKVGSLVEEAVALREFLAEGNAQSVDTSAPIALDVGGGLLRMNVSMGAGRVRNLDAWVGVLTRLRQRQETLGGSLTLAGEWEELVGEVGRWGLGAGEDRVVEGLRRVFDPGGVLSAGRRGL